VRLKEDSSSHRASGVIARDARHVHNGPEVPRAVRGKKDRKRWCGGKEGREHTPKNIGWHVGRDDDDCDRIVIFDPGHTPTTGGEPIEQALVENGREAL